MWFFQKSSTNNFLFVFEVYERWWWQDISSSVLVFFPKHIYSEQLHHIVIKHICIIHLVHFFHFTPYWCHEYLHVSYRMCHFPLFGYNVTHLFCIFFTLVDESNKKKWKKISKIVNSIVLVIHMHSMWCFSNSNNNHYYNMAKMQIHRKNIVFPPRYFLRTHLRLKFISIKWANISIVISFQHFEILFFSWISLLNGEIPQWWW